MANLAKREGFISATEYLKGQAKTPDTGLTQTLLTLSMHHALFDSKRVVRSMVDITAAYHLRKTTTGRNLQAAP